MDKDTTTTCFNAINEDIKAVLDELEEEFHDHPYVDTNDISKNNAAFIKILDQLLELQGSLDEVKKDFITDSCFT
jgi:hypothetical protein